MDLLLSGHPLHTRLQTVAVHRSEDGIAVEGSHLDLRKRGFVPVGADLQASGIIHQMTVRAGLDLLRPALVGVESAMAVPAFESSKLTGGESCRDVAGGRTRIERLPLDDGASRSVADAMAGARGCSHLLALTQLAASTVRYALPDADDWDVGPPRRLFHRSMVIDGAQPDDRTIDLALQLSDLFFAPAAAVSNPMDRFARQYELRVLVRIDLSNVVVSSLAVAERGRDRSELHDAEWRRRDESVAALLLAPFLGGFAKRVFECLPDAAADRPLIDALLGLAPTFIQVCGCFSEDWPRRCMAVDTLVGVGGIPNACYMWRRDGALHSRKKPTDPMGGV